MDYINEKIKECLANSSMIRRMFEVGIELKKKYGADNVYDFSLGNPDLPPPPQVKEALTAIAAGADKPFALGYMPNAGFPELRQQIAEQVSREQGQTIGGSHVVVCCGAAGAWSTRPAPSAPRRTSRPWPLFFCGIRISGRRTSRCPPS